MKLYINYYGDVVTKKDGIETTDIFNVQKNAKELVKRWNEAEDKNNTKKVDNSS